MAEEKLHSALSVLPPIYAALQGGSAVDVGRCIREAVEA